MTRYSEPFTDHGSDTTMLITARVEDFNGATATATYEAEPTLRTVAVNSPVAVNINGVTAASAQVVAGSAVELNAPLTSSYWRFDSWSDGGAATHSFTMPDRDLTLAAHYLTAIDLKYAQLGGASSFLGRPTTTEYDVPGGRARNYRVAGYTGALDHWSARGAWAILTKYLAGGGPGRFGLPTTDEIAVTGGRASYFTNARIYWSPSVGAHEVHGALLTKYLAGGGPGRFRSPTTDEIAVTSGRASYFTRGPHLLVAQRWSARGTWGTAHQVPCRRRTAAFGLPTTDEIAVTSGRASYFTKARIYWSPSTGPHFSRGVLLAKYLAAGGPERLWAAGD